MNLAIIEFVNGSYKVKAEGFDSEENALVSFHSECSVLHNASDVIEAQVAIVDGNLNIYRGYTEHINHAN